MSGPSSLGAAGRSTTASDANSPLRFRRESPWFAVTGLAVAVSLLNPSLLAMSVGPVYLPLYRLLLVGACVALQGIRRRLPMPSLAKYVCFTWGVVCVLSLVLHPLRQESIGVAVTYGVDAASVLLLLRHHIGRRILHAAFRALFWLIVVSAAIAVLEYAVGHYLVPDGVVALRTRSRYGHIRGQGLAPHPLVLGAASSAAVFFADEFIRRRMFLRAARVVLIGGILASQSRSPLLALLLGVTFVAVAKVNRQAARRLVPVAVVLLGASILLLPDNGTGGVTTDEAANSSAYRSALLRVGAEAVVTKPLGLGFGDLREGIGNRFLIRRFNGSRYDFGTTVDNQFVISALYGGVPLLSALLFVSYVTLRAQRRRRHGAHLALVTNTLASMLFLATLNFAVTAFIFWYVVAESSLIDRVQRENSHA